MGAPKSFGIIKQGVSILAMLDTKGSAQPTIMNKSSFGDDWNCS